MRSSIMAALALLAATATACSAPADSPASTDAATTSTTNASTSASSSSTSGTSSSPASPGRRADAASQTLVRATTSDVRFEGITTPPQLAEDLRRCQARCRAR